MSNLKRKLEEHSVSHKNDFNVKLHTLGIPGTFFGIIGLLSIIPVPAVFRFMDFGLIISVMALIYYVQFGIRILFMMVPFYGLLYGMNKVFIHSIDLYPFVLIGILIVSSALLFWGHKVEGEKPGSYRNILNSLVGPLWFVLHISGIKENIIK